MKTAFSIIIAVFLFLNAKAQEDTTKRDSSLVKATFTPITDLPEPKGGAGELYEVIRKNLKKPQAAKDNRTKGRVLVSFVVEKDGSLSNFQVIKGLGDGCDEEAIRVLKLSPKWTPGLYNGSPVRVNYTVPVVFN